MIQVILEMDEQGGDLNIRAALHPDVVFAIAVNAYHLMLSQKIQSDMEAARKRVSVADGLTMQKAIESAKRIVS